MFLNFNGFPFERGTDPPPPPTLHVSIFIIISILLKDYKDRGTEIMNREYQSKEFEYVLNPDV